MPTNILLNSGRAVNRKIRNFTRFFCVCTVQNAEPRTHSSNPSPLRNGCGLTGPYSPFRSPLRLTTIPRCSAGRYPQRVGGKAVKPRRARLFLIHRGVEYALAPLIHEPHVRRITIWRHIGHRDAAEMLAGTGAHPSGQATGDGRDRQDCQQLAVLRPAISERPGDRSGSSLRGQHRSSTRPKNATVSGIRLRGMRSLRL